MSENELYMQRCIDLAVNGLGNVAPNPLVGAVVVHENKIIGEGYHKKYGTDHAEVNAINNIKNSKLLPYSTLYVNLEPCCHYGKTPPCTDIIIKSGIKKVVIGNIDVNQVVAGKGVLKLRNNGCEVVTGILKNECFDLNKRYFTFLQKKRPYIILKWAQSADNYIDKKRGPNDEKKPNWITGKVAQTLVHKWRSEEQAIMIGANTVMTDNPKLNTRLWHGKDPLRIVIDPELEIPDNYSLFDNTVKTLIVNQKKNDLEENTTWLKVDCFCDNFFPDLMSYLYKENIQSIIVEGGTKLLQSFIDVNLWDEARIFTGKQFFGEGLRAPDIKGKKVSETKIQKETLCVLKNKVV